MELGSDNRHFRTGIFYRVSGFSRFQVLSSALVVVLSRWAFWMWSEVTCYTPSFITGGIPPWALRVAAQKIVQQTLQRWDSRQWIFALQLDFIRDQLLMQDRDQVFFAFWNGTGSTCCSPAPRKSCFTSLLLLAQRIVFQALVKGASILSFVGSSLQADSLCVVADLRICSFLKDETPVPGPSYQSADIFRKHL